QLVGIDVECSDIINVPIEQSKGVILEVNHKPSIRIHEFPMKGPSYKEYLYVNAESFFNSLAIASFSSLLAKNVLDFSIKDLSKYH
ncbi:hypothetical protein MXD98_16680, partial [Legionella pneumophila]|nr:hypothetical protein [Legionella pneumophila]